MCALSRSEGPQETYPMKVKNMTFMIDRLHADCAPLQFVRELTQNSIEAIQSLPDKKGEIIWDVDWNKYALSRAYKLTIIDTGIGMTGAEMVEYINSLSSSVHEQSVEGNYGIGAKIAAVPRNKAGLIYLSWKDGIGYMVHIWHDPDTNEYGVRKIYREDGSAEYWTIIDNTLKPKEIDDHGTMVILLGNDIDENTMQAPPETPAPTFWVLRYLNARYFKFPKSVAVKAREGWERPQGDQYNFLRTVTGMKPWLDENSLLSGIVGLNGAKAHWWILKESEETGTHGRYVGGGHIAALYKDELYEMQTGRAGAATLQAFGVIFGYKRVVIYLEPINGNQNQLASNTSRTALLLNGEPLPWSDWAAEFREKMPYEIKRHIEEMSASTVKEDHQSIWERLKQISDLFKLSRYRPMKTGPLIVDDQGPPVGGISKETDKRKTGNRTFNKGGGQGGRAGDIYALFQATQGINAEQIRSTIPQLRVEWIFEDKGTRNPPDLEDRAAKFLPEQLLILINGDFRIFTDMIERWNKKYPSPGARSVIQSVVHEWFEQQLIEAVIGALALKGSSQWTTQDVAKVWSEEALTSVVLPRYHIDVSIKRALGAKLGSLKEVVT